MAGRAKGREAAGGKAAGGSIHPPGRRAGNASERVYDELKRQILRGELPVGTVLTEKDVAETMGVSRTPLREALGLLREDGLVEVGPRRQLVVTKISPERRHEVFLLMNLLERVAVEHACAEMPIEEMDYLRLLLFRQRRAANAESPEDWIDLDDEFHMAIAAGAQLPVLARFLDQLRMQVRMIGVGNVERPGRMHELIDQHEEIVNALEARDEAAAIEILDNHLSGIESALASD